MVSKDIIIIGGGLAGLTAAASLPKGKALIIRGSRQSNTLRSDARFIGPRESLASGMLRAGRGLCDRPLVSAFCRELPRSRAWLAGQVPLGKWSSGFIVPSAARLTKAIEAKSQIAMVDGEAFEIIEDDGRIAGVVFQDSRGAVRAASCKSLILATGGFAGLYGRTDNADSCDGAALAAALRAGAALKDPEFVFFHPFVSRGACIPADSLANAPIRGVHGERLAEVERLLRTGEIHEHLSEAALRVFQAGGATATLGTRTISFGPAAHTTLGGITIRPDTSTGVEGLFSCGESAAGPNGADRIGGVGLSWALASGRMAAKAALAHSERTKASDVIAPRLRAGSEREYSSVFSGIRTALDSGCFVDKNGRGLRDALARIRELEGSLGDSAWALRGRLVCEVAEALLLSSMARSESRGCFHRSDHQEENKALEGSFFAERKNNKLRLRFKKSGAPKILTT